MTRRVNTIRIAGNQRLWPMADSAEMRGFTLVELLVVISLIALLATLTVGLSGVAARKSRESRIKSDLNKLVTSIDNYRSAIGAFPRDSGKPSTNQLFYELVGTYFEGSGPNGNFVVPSGERSLTAAQVQQVFNAPGFGNSVRRGDQLKVTEEFKASQHKEIIGPPNFEVLIVPVKGPQQFTIPATSIKAPLELKASDGTLVNPWLYESSSPTRNNRDGFDLWTEVIIGKNIVRFSNWEKDPVVVGKP